MVSLTRSECSNWLQLRIPCHARPCFVYQIEHWKNFLPSPGEGPASVAAAPGKSWPALRLRRLKHSTSASAYNSANSVSVKSRRSRSRRRAIVQCQVVTKCVSARACSSPEWLFSATSFHNHFSPLLGSLDIFPAKISVGVSCVPGNFTQLINFPLNFCG